jgi:hypothetical protein
MYKFKFCFSVTWLHSGILSSHSLDCEHCCLVECDAVYLGYPDAGNRTSLCNVDAPTRLNRVTFQRRHYLWLQMILWLWLASFFNNRLCLIPCSDHCFFFSLTKYFCVCLLCFAICNLSVDVSRWNCDISVDCIIPGNQITVQKNSPIYKSESVLNVIYYLTLNKYKIMKSYGYCYCVMKWY